MPPVPFFALTAAIATTVMTNLTTTSTTATAMTSIPEDYFEMTQSSTMAAQTTTKRATVTFPVRGMTTTSYQSTDTITTLESFAMESTTTFTDRKDDTMSEKEELSQGQSQTFVAQADPLKQLRESNFTVNDSEMTFRPPTLNASIAEKTLAEGHTNAPPPREEDEEDVAQDEVDRSFETVHPKARQVSPSQLFDAQFVSSDGLQGNEKEASDEEESNAVSDWLARLIEEADRALERSAAVLGKTNSTHAAQDPHKTTAGQKPDCGQRPQLEYLVLLIGPLAALFIVVAAGTGCFCLARCLDNSALQEQGRQQVATYQSSEGPLPPGTEGRQDNWEDPGCTLCRQEPCRASSHRRGRDGRGVHFGTTQEENPAKRSLPSVPAGASSLLTSMAQVPPPETDRHESKTTTITVDVDQVKKLNEGSRGSPSYRESLELELMGRKSATTLRSLGKTNLGLPANLEDMGGQGKAGKVDPCAIYSNVPAKGDR